MIVEKLKCDKKRYLALLLSGDEQEYMIDRYIDRGDMSALSMTMWLLYALSRVKRSFWLRSRT